MVALSAQTTELKPFLKWAGGKRQLLPELFRYMPSQFNRYYEPFLGGGALLFALAPSRAVVGDSNAELVNCYRIVRHSVDELIQALQLHRNESEYFYQIRAWDRAKDYHQRSAVERASRLIYLNRTCYNGLYRVNRKNQQNAPFGRYKNPRIVNAPLLNVVSGYLSQRDIRIERSDFADLVADAKRGDFIYFDPPYDPVSETASFTSYAGAGFDRAEQIRLKQTVDELARRGCKVLLSNSCTEFICSLYADYRCIQVQASRAINSKALKRGKVAEVIVMNY